MKALSIWQPWAWLIVHGGKDVENRKWPTRYRGPLFIHASKRVLTVEELADLAGWLPPGARLPVVGETEYGGIIGQVDMVDCVTESQIYAPDWPWFVGPYGFVLRNPQPLPFRAVRGRQGLFEVTL